MLSLLEKRPWLRYLDYKFPWSISYPNFPAFQMLRDAANVAPDKAATWFYGAEITFWDLYITCIRMANALTKLGVTQGDRVGILLPNCPQFSISFWSILATGAIAVNINPIYTVEELKHVHNITELKGIITYDPLIPKVKELSEFLEIPVIMVTTLADYKLNPARSTAESLNLPAGWHHFSDVLDGSTDTKPPRVTIKPHDPALIQFTGGTTGIPKGATLTQNNLVAGTYQVVMAGESLIGNIAIADRSVLATLPLFHVYGEICCLTYGILASATLILIPRFDLDDFFNVISQWDRITFWPGVPTMLSAVFNDPRAEEMNLGRKFAFVNNGAAPAPLELLQRCKDLNVYISEGWGMSETVSVGISNPVQGIKKPLSIGVPYPDNDVRIVDPDTLEDVPSGERGEIWLKGPTVMMGYWNNPAETKKQLIDGWLRTGDIAYQDEDGYVFIVDRTKDMVISGGYNVYPRDIDEVLYKHPKVKDVISIGIPDEYRGESIKSFVQLVEGATVTAEELIAFSREHLAPFKVPREIEFRDSLPRTEVGKALRRLLRDEELNKTPNS